MSGESHLESALTGGGGSGGGESHIASCLGGGGGSLAGESHIQACLAVLPPPGMGHVLHWFDFLDITTLWQDTAGTVPITASGQAIARVDNKGSDPSIPIQGTPANRPLYDTAQFPLGAAAFSTSINEVLNVVVAAGLGQSRTCAAVWAPSNVGALDAGFVFNWGGSNDFWIVQNSSDQQQLRAGGHLTTSVAASANNQLNACFMVVRNTPDSQEHWNNLDPGSTTRLLSSVSGPSASQDLSIGNDAVSPSSSNAFTGFVQEIIVWDIEDELAGPTFAGWKAYTESRHGVVWA